jgi:hypothetical protein
MQIHGVAKVCLFKACGKNPAANLSVPLDVVGVGGTVTATGSVNVTVKGAPWTVGFATLSPNTPNFQIAGFRHGPASNAVSSSASGTVRLVTPIHVSTNLGASPVVLSWAVLDLHFVPEPSTLLLLSGGIAGLVMLGRSKRD